jgi:hypothetical protein
MYLITDKDTRLQEDQQKRIMPKFDEGENHKLDRSISSSMNDMTQKIKLMEQNIKAIKFEKVSSGQEDIGNIF